MFTARVGNSNAPLKVLVGIYTFAFRRTQLLGYPRILFREYRDAVAAFDGVAAYVIFRPVGRLAP